MDLLIFWDESAPAGFGASLSRSLSSLLPLEIHICDSPLIVNGFIPARQQTDAAALLDTMDLYKRRTALFGLLLLVVSEDLCRQGDESLFGLARQATGTAVVSSARLENEFYGLRRDDESFLDRLTKESAHEIAHLLGLSHCGEVECIMHNPLTLDDLDRKRRGFCPSCLGLIEESVR